MEFADVINSFASPDPIGIIKVSTTYVDGRPTQTEAKAVLIAGAVQPAVPAVYNRAPEGSKTHEVLTFYISTIITAEGEQISIENGDILSYRGVRYIVFEASDWNHIGDYNEASGAKELT